MSILDAMTIDWSVSPRIILFPNTIGEIAIQDLIDTLRTEEGKLENAGYKTIVRASGKQSLTASLLVGITCTLLNAQLEFLVPGGPTVRRDIKGGNLLAIDDMDVSMNPILNTQFTQVVYDLSPAPTINVGGVAGSSRGYVIIQG